MAEAKAVQGFGPPPENLPEAPEPHETGRTPGKIYTFYSFKGGVGRSMAMANIAVLAARAGRKVLVVDFDLEAPGLEHFFYKHAHSLADRLAQTPGVIDILQADRPDWRACIAEVGLPGGVQLDILHSGRASRDQNEYTNQVQLLNWSELYQEHKIGGVFGAIREEWIEIYDYVFIDSRTGVTDIGDLCTVVLPDHLVLLFITNRQNIEGISGIYRRAVAEHGRMPIDRAKLTVLPVLSRDEFYSEYEKSNEWRRRAAEDLSDLFADWLPQNLGPLDALQKIFIPYFAIWSFGEALPVVDRPEEISNPASITAAYSRIAALILNDLDWSCLDKVADPAEIAQSRVDQQAEFERKHAELAAEFADRRRRTVRQAGVVAAMIVTVIGVLGYYIAEGWRAQAESDRAIAEAEAREAQRRVAQLQETLDRLSQQTVETTTLTKQLASLTNDLSEERAQRAALHSEMELLEATLSAARKETSAAESRCASYLADHKVTQAQLSREQDQIRRLRSTVDSAAKSAPKDCAAIFNVIQEAFR